MKFRSGRDPVLYLSNPSGYSREARRRYLDDLSKLNQMKLEEYQDPEISDAHFAVRDGVPDADLRAGAGRYLVGAAVHVRAVRTGSRKPGSFAANCMLARRLAERGVRFIQLFHRGWDQHDNLPQEIGPQCKQTDQPSAALIQDLKQRGMLDDTLVIWGGEFGRTVYSQGTLTDDNYGRDHHPRCFSMWMAGGGMKGGVTYGDDGRVQLQHHGKSRPRARSARHDPALSRRRSHAPDVQIPGPTFPPHGCPRSGRERYHHLAVGVTGSNVLYRRISALK